MLRRLAFLSLAFLILVPSAASAGDDDTIFWVGLGTGLTFFNETDPDPVEDLATALSILPTNPGSTRRLNFDDKGYEIPIDARFGWRLTSSINVWAMFQRIPYVIEGPVPSAQPGSNPSNPPDDSITLRMPANIYGGGFDFRLGSKGYGNSLILSLGGGVLKTEGYDQDVLGLTNYTVTGTGYMWEVALLSEIDFGGGLYFYPFLSFRSARTTDVSGSFVRGTGIDDFNDFEVDYTGVSLGFAARFKVFPFDVGGDSGKSPWDD